ncbi:MAG: VWA domain-containing protein, partial [Candidatus Pacearchaeota archaeon]
MKLSEKRSGRVFIIIAGLIAFSIFSLSLTSVCAAIVGGSTTTTINKTADVGYIYSKQFLVDNNVIKTLNELNLTVDKIRYSDLYRANLSKYRFLFVGDERFFDATKIPISKYNFIIENYDHGKVWGLTDNDGISKLVGSKPLMVNVKGQTPEVYTQAFFQEGSSVAIPYYYLADVNKNPAFYDIARTVGATNGNDGDVIAFANASTRLLTGQLTNGKLCYYGIIESDFWTPEAKSLFKDCVAFVSSECSSRGECPSDSISDQYCINKSVYRDVSNYTCENPGKVNSECIAVAKSQFIKLCPKGCIDGECVECINDSDCDDHNIRTIDSCVSHVCKHENITCINNSDCNDLNPRTVDICRNPGTLNSSCENINVTCLTNSDCGLNGFFGDKFCFNNNVFKNFENFTCLLPGTLNSSCLRTNSSKLFQNCRAYGCENGECLGPECINNSDCDDGNSSTTDLCINEHCEHRNIRCFTDIECDDQNSTTIDRCVNPGTVESYCTNSLFNCGSDADCGLNGFLGVEFCSTNNVYKLFQNATCMNPGTHNSNCVVTRKETLVNDCGENSCEWISDPFCKNGDIYKRQSCTVRGCQSGGIAACFVGNVSEQEILIKDCLSGCENGSCLGLECTKDLDCDDGNSSTTDRCVNNHCTHEPIECLTDIECDDHDPRTIDKCIDNHCHHNPLECINSSDCDDGNSSTIDICLYNSCNHIPVLPVCGNGVLESGEQCDDGNRINGDGCSVNCIAERQICREICSGGAIDFDLLADRSGSMNRYLDPPVNSIFSKITKIQALRDASKNLTVGAIGRNPQTKVGLSTFSTEFTNEHDLSSDLNSLNDKLIHIYANGNSDTNYNESIRDSVDKIRIQGRNMPKIIVFLSDGEPTVVTSKDSSGTFSDPEDVKSAIDAANYARMNGVVIVTIGFGKKSELNETLLRQMAEITGGRYFFVDSYEQVLNLYSGIGSRTCQIICESTTVTCRSNLDCNDGNVFTRDICVNPGMDESYCSHETQNCNSNFDCNDFNPQTTDKCVNNRCIFIPGECLNNLDCDDGNMRTIDVCLNAGGYDSYCTHNSLQCIYDSDCNDGNRLTIDRCMNNNCQHNFIECADSSDCNDGNSQTTDVCVNNRCQHNQVIECYRDLDCGITGFINEDFCYGKDVFGIFESATCVNNLCYTPRTTMLKENCRNGCFGGNCIQDECSFNSQCDDGNRLTVDLCTNGRCEHNPIQCTDNSDCNDNNPRTIDSCLNNRCSYTPIVQCNFDSQCDDGNQRTFDSCRNPGTMNSYCSHDSINCLSNGDCEDGNAQTRDTCVNAGTLSSYCRNDLLQCISDFQCGSVTTQRFCSGGNVMTRTLTPKCLSNSCTSQTNEVLSQVCNYG